MRKTYNLFILVNLFYTAAHAQKQWCNWIGQPFGITFRYGSPVTFSTNTSPNGIPFPFSDPDYYNGSRAVAYSDSITGQLKFIATNRVIYSRNYDTVANGYGLYSCGDAGKYTVQIIPFPGGENKFYILHNWPGETPIYGLQTICSVYSYITGANPGLRYSILDLDQNNGLGKVTSKNNYFPAGGDKLAIIRHANQNDVWVVGHGGNGTTFTSTLINNSGIQTSSFQTIPFATFPYTSTWSRGGEIETSPDGNTIAITSSTNRNVNLYHFNKTTGTISYYDSVLMPGYANFLCFSPDGSKLYVGTFEYSSCSSKTSLYQIDFNEQNLPESIFPLYIDNTSSSNWEMERTPEHKILIQGKSDYDFNSGWSQHRYYAIEYPNQPKTACFLNTDAFTAFDNTIYFPNLINDHEKQSPEVQTYQLNMIKDTAVCLGSFTINAPPGYPEYRWNNGATTSSITVTEPGLYTVMAGTTGFLRPNAIGFTRVREKSQSFDLGSDTLLCPNSNYTLSLPAGFSNIVWHNGDTSHQHFVNSGGKQTFIAKDVNGCRISDSVCVNFRYLPRAEFGNDTVLCSGESVLLRMEPWTLFYTAPPPPAFLWSNGSTTDSLRITQPGTYWGRVNYQGCTASDTIQVNFVSAATLDIGRDTVLCYGNTLHLAANINNAHYIWSTGDTTQSIDVNYSSDYWVKVFNGSCWAIDTVRVQFVNPPVVNLGNDTTICEGSSLQLTAYVQNGNVRWQDGSTYNYLNVTTPGTYWVEARIGGCISSDTIHVLFKPKPVVNLGMDTTICMGENLMLNAAQPSFVSYLWNNGNTQPNFLAQGAGTYWVKVQGVNGCFGYDTIVIQIAPPPVFTLGADKTVCANEPVNYSFNLGNVGYLWNTGATTGSITINQPGLYWLQVNNHGCRKSDSVLITHKPMPSVVLGNDTTLCGGSSKTLNAFNTGATYLWSNGNTTSSIIVNQPGIYDVAVNLNGCILKDTIQVNYHYVPVFSLGNDTVICDGHGLELNPGNVYGNYIWQDGSGSSTYHVTQPGIYQLTITNECGGLTDAITITKGLCTLMMPNAFTPNGDGLNDLFILKFPQFLKNFEMTIYNKRGVQLYHSRNAYEGWNGTFKNKLQPPENYIWRIHYTDLDGYSKTTWGTVMLIR